MSEIKGLDSLKSDFDSLFVNLSDAQERIADEIVKGWSGNIVRRSGQTADSIKAENPLVTGDAREILIDNGNDTSVVWLDVIERGSQKYHRAGLYPAKNFLDEAESLFHSIIDDALGQTFHGN